MRSQRLKIEECTSVYHCMSRIVGREFLLSREDRKYMERLLRKLSLFSGVEIITYTAMTNHFHLLLRVKPKVTEMTDEELIRRAGILYEEGSIELNRIKRLLLGEEPKEEAERFRREREKLRKSLIERMNDLSHFMQEFKQRFTQVYNERYGREGTLWTERFKSVLVENNPLAVIMKAAYIDLNALRAGMVEDPKDYEYSGYGRAVRGDKMAQEMLMSIGGGEYANETWSEFERYYRKLLFGKGACREKANQAVIPNERVSAVMEERELEMFEQLRGSIEHFKHGVAVGSKAYVESIYERFFSRRGDGELKKRKRGVEEFMKVKRVNEGVEESGYVLASLKPVKRRAGRLEANKVVG